MQNLFRKISIFLMFGIFSFLIISLSTLAIYSHLYAAASLLQVAAFIMSASLILAVSLDLKRWARIYRAC